LPSAIGLLAALLGLAALDRIDYGGGHAGDRCRRFLNHLLGNTAHAGMVTLNHGADRITQVAQQVPAVGDLDSIRRALTHAVCVGVNAG